MAAGVARVAAPASFCKMIMHSYTLFGRCFDSELAFPDLSPGARLAPAWTLRVAPAGAVLPVGPLAGCKPVWDGTASAYRTPVGWRLDFPYVGSYVVSDDGSDLAWHPLAGATEELSRAVVLGPIMALALHAAGTICLHGSAVAVSGSAIGFLAPKFHGKSTLALALTAAGARLITDDAIAIDLDCAPRVRAGVHSVRLLADSAAALRASELPATLLPGGKLTLSSLAPDMLRWEDTPLAALYLLRPVRDAGTSALPRRTVIDRLRAAMAIVGHSKLGSQLGGPAVAAEQLRWSASLACAVPVYDLELPRGYDRLDRVVAEILDWHAGEAAVFRGGRALPVQLASVPT